MLGSGDIHYFVKVANIGYLAKIKIFLKFYDFKQFFNFIFTYVLNFKSNGLLEVELLKTVPPIRQFFDLNFSTKWGDCVCVKCNGTQKIKKMKKSHNSIKIAKNDRINAVNSIKAK